MLGADKAELFSNVPREMKARLAALKEVDPVLYSNSRVVTECLDAHVQKIEQRAFSFPKPIHGSPVRRKRLARV